MEVSKADGDNARTTLDTLKAAELHNQSGRVWGHIALRKSYLEQYWEFHIYLSSTFKSHNSPGFSFFY